MKNLTEKLQSEVSKEVKKESKTLLVLKGGTLRLAEPDEFKKKNGEDIDIRHYTTTTVDGLYTIVDFDKTEVKPLVRSILGQIGLYPELGIVKMNRNMLFVLVGVCILTWYTTTGLLTSKAFTEAQTSIIDNIKKTCSTKLTSVEIPGVVGEEPDEKSFKIFGK